MSFSLQAQNSWQQEANFSGGNREEGCAFSIGTTGYFIAGIKVSADTDYNDVWAWSQSTNSWTKETPLPAATRIGAASASLFGYGYLSGGEHPSTCFKTIGHSKGFKGGVCAGTFYSDFWRYNPDSNTWCAMAAFPGGGRDFGVMVADPVDSSIFYGTGNNNTALFFSDWWVYHVPTNTWTQLDSFPGGQRCYAVGFYANGNVYVGTGDNADGKSNAKSDMWEYNISSGSWSQVADLPGTARREASAFSLGNDGYVCLGIVNDSDALGDMWKYDAVQNAWTQVASYPQGIGYFASAFGIGNKGYVGIGTKDQNDTSTFYQYSPDTTTGINTIINNKESISVFPNPSQGIFNYEAPSDSPIRGGTIKVYNALGQIVFSQFNIQHSEFKIDLTGQPEGVYFYQVTSSTGNVVSTGKVLIVK